MVGLITFMKVANVLNSNISPRRQPMVRKWIAIFSLVIGWTVAYATPQVLVTIKPIHSLVASIMEGVAKPTWLLPDGASPHTFHLKPSHLRQIQQADIVIWIGPSLELFMVKPLQGIPAEKRMNLSDIKSLEVLSFRQGRVWQNDEKDHHHDHTLDPHFWLSTDNAILIGKTVANFLSEVDQAHALIYQSNAKKLEERIHLLRKNLDALLTHDHSIPFLVYHDAYQYF